MVGQKIKEIRKSKNMTQLELAQILKVTPGAIGLWETGKREPDNKVLIQLAQYFNVSVDYLLDINTQNKIAIMGRDGSYRTFYLKEKDLQAIENLAESLECDKSDKED